MPSLSIFGQRNNIGSDDITIPAAIDAAASIAYGCTLGYQLWKQSSLDLSCLSESSVSLFLLGQGVLTAANVAVLLANIHISLKGTLINTYPRRHITKAIKAKMGLETARFVFLTNATKWAYWDLPAVCPLGTRSFLKHVCQMNWVLCIWGILSVLRFVPFTHMRRHLARRNTMVETDVTMKKALYKKWSDRLHQLASLAGFEPDATLNMLADLFSDFFQNDVDLVPGDILMALILLDRKQFQRRRTLTDPLSADPRHSPTAPVLENFPPLQTKDWMNDIDLVSHFMHYAMGAYGWPYFILRSPIGGLHLFRAYLQNRRLPKGTHVDNPTFITRMVIKKTTGLSHEDIVYISVTNTCFCLPFFIALDHKYKKIVVTIRGTLSMEDVLVDLTAAPAEEEELKVPGMSFSSTGGANVHSGMLTCARSLYERLLEPHTDNPHGRPLLEMAREVLRMRRGESAVEEYGVLVTGHSLGAGTAGILSVLLHSVMPVQCIAYSPPGWTVSLNLARYMEPFTLSVVLGDDVVSRMGLTNAWNLKMDILRIIKDCDIPKYEVLGSWLEGLFAVLVGQSRTSTREMNYRRSWLDNAPAREQVWKYQANIEAAIERCRKCRDLVPPLYLPGCVLYVEEMKQNRWLWRRSRYAGTFLRGDSPYFDEILLQKSLIEHHSPWNVEAALSWMSENHVNPAHVVNYTTGGEEVVTSSSSGDNANKE